MKHLILFRMLFLAAIALPMLATANDSAARLGAGGLTLVKNHDIRMLEEELEISTKKIRVRYRFLNESNRDIREIVAFPMPPFGYTGLEFYENDRPFSSASSFKVFVNGKPVVTKMQQQAVIGQLDVTQQLRKIGLSEAQIFETFGGCDEDSDTRKCGLTKQQVSKIFELSKKDDVPTSWKVLETAYWEQTFPAGTEVEVIHEYEPFVGYVYTTAYAKYLNNVNGTSEETRLGSVVSQSPSEACVDDGVQHDIDKRLKKLTAHSASGFNLLLKDVEYILGTGRNWKGPINQFKLRIIKNNPEDLVSLCFPGKAVKVNPTTLEFSQSNFIPQDKLVIYFYSINEQTE